MTNRRRIGDTKVDPMIGLVERADRALNEHIRAHNRFHSALDKLRGPRRAWVSPPATFLPGYWRLDHQFTSVKHIEGEFRKLRSAFRRGWNATNTTAYGPPKKAVDAVMRKSQLAAIPKVQRLLIHEFREKEAEIRNAERKLGLADLRLKKKEASTALRDITKQIAQTKPVTAAGALAAIGYVQMRLSREDLIDLFTHNSDYPGKFDRVLRAAYTVLGSMSR